MLIPQQKTSPIISRIGKFWLVPIPPFQERLFPEIEGCFSEQLGSTPTEGENQMKKLLTLTFAVLFVVALSSLSFAQAPVLAPEGETVVMQDEVVVQTGAVYGCCAPMPYGCYAPRPFYRGRYAANYCNPCCNPCPAPCPPRPVCAPCPPPCPPRPVCCAPTCDPCCDPCYAPGYGYRTPVRNFLGRVFSGPYYGYGYGCPPYGYGY